MATDESTGCWLEALAQHASNQCVSRASRRAHLWERYGTRIANSGHRTGEGTGGRRQVARRNGAARAGKSRGVPSIDRSCTQGRTLDERSSEFGACGFVGEERLAP